MDNKIGAIWQQLKKVAEVIKEENKTVNIIMNHSDPDMFGSAWALKHILRKLGIPNARIRILATGEVGEKQNQMIIDRFGLSQHIIKLADYWPKLNGNDLYAFVDASNPNDGRLGEAYVGKMTPIIVIDHHTSPAPEETGDNFIWVQKGGACATMLAKLLTEAGMMKFSKEEGDDLFVPVLLTLGIYGDTSGLLKCVTDDDVSAYISVYQLSNKQDLHVLTNIPDSEKFVEAENYARMHCIKDGLRLISCAGYLPSNRSQVWVSKFANMMVNWENITIAVVFAVDDDCRLVFSIRSTDLGLITILDDVLHRKFQNSFGLKISDDGMRLEGAAQIGMRIDLAADVETREKHLEVVTTYMKKIFFGNDMRG